MFLLNSMHKRTQLSNIFDTSVYFGTYFGLKKDKLFCPVFVFCKGMSNTICDIVLYLQSEGLIISCIYPGTTQFQYLKTVLAIHYSTLSLT